MRVDATHIDANASLISNEVDVLDLEPGALERLRDRVRRAEAGVGRRSTPTEAHDLTIASGLRPCSSRSRSRRGPSRRAPSLSPDELPAVMLKPSISGCSGFSDASFSIVVVAARVLVDLEDLGLAVAALHLEREDLLLEAALVDRLDRAPVRLERPEVHLLARDVRLLRGVPPDGDRHVERGRVGRLGVARRHPRLHVVGAQDALHRPAARSRRTRRRRRSRPCPCRP